MLFFISSCLRPLSNYQVKISRSNCNHSFVTSSFKTKPVFGLAIEDCKQNISFAIRAEHLTPIELSTVVLPRCSIPSKFKLPSNILGPRVNNSRSWGTNAVCMSIVESRFYSDLIGYLECKHWNTDLGMAGWIQSYILSKNRLTRSNKIWRYSDANIVIYLSIIT